MEIRLKMRLLTGEVVEYSVRKSHFLIGRARDCDVVTPFDGFSRRHCEVEFTTEGIFVTDLGSTNGVLIDEERIPPHVRTPYLPSLLLSIGGAIEVSFEDLSGTTLELEAAPANVLTLQTAASGGATRSLQLPRSARMAKADSRRRLRGPVKSSWVFAVVTSLIVILAVTILNPKEESLDSLVFQQRMQKRANDGSIPTTDF